MKKTFIISMAVAAGMTLASCSSDNANPEEGNVQKVEAAGISFDMIYIAPGTFNMGATSEQDGYDSHSETPVHQVTLTKGYWMARTEVTQELWKAVMGYNNAEITKYADKDDCQFPAMNISWKECVEFCKKLSNMTGKQFRLPTEAEWEYAARGASKTNGLQYSGSKYLDRVACFKQTSNGTAHPVGQYMPNELDIRDMNGNVAEWVMDGYQQYKDSAMTDPCFEMPDSMPHTVRGGHFLSGMTDCRTATRKNYDSTTKSATIGLRVVMQ